MCFTVTDPKIKIAKEDIVCYKTIKHHRNGAVSQVMEYRYYKNKRCPSVKLRKQETSYCCTTNVYEITRGYHSYITEDYFDLWNGGPNAIFIIPKGTRYYENYHERVSETIIFKGWL